MPKRKQAARRQDAALDSVEPGRQRLLIVDPDRLTRWSMGEYLHATFEVYAADNTAAAIDVLNQHPVDAVVVAEDLPCHGADDVEDHARAANPETTVIRMFTQPGAKTPERPRTRRIEKPFALSALARLLVRSQ